MVIHTLLIIFRVFISVWWDCIASHYGFSWIWWSSISSISTICAPLFELKREYNWKFQTTLIQLNRLLMIVQQNGQNFMHNFLGVWLSLKPLWIEASSNGPTTANEIKDLRAMTDMSPAKKFDQLYLQLCTQRFSAYRVPILVSWYSTNTCNLISGMLSSIDKFILCTGLVAQFSVPSVFLMCSSETHASSAKPIVVTRQFHKTKADQLQKFHTISILSRLRLRGLRGLRDGNDKSLDHLIFKYCSNLENGF